MDYRWSITARKLPTNLKNGLTAAYRIGISRATPLTGVLKFPMHPVNISTFGSMRQSAIWPATKISVHIPHRILKATGKVDFRLLSCNHFIGKDIAYFHTLFWPATLEGAGFSQTHRRICPWFFNRRRRQNVQIPRHLY